MKATSGLKAPRIADVIAKLINTASSDWRNVMFSPSNGASMALSSALPSVVSKNHQRKFDPHVQRLHRITPPTHRGAITTRARNDDREVKRKPPRLEPRRHCPSASGSPRSRTPSSCGFEMVAWAGTDYLDCGGKRSAPPLGLRATSMAESTVVAALRRSTPQFARQTNHRRRPSARGRGRTVAS